MRSAAKNDDEALRQLLRDGADVNAVNTETGETATAVACRLGHVEALQALYEGHASFFSCTQDARTAAMVAAGNNQWRILEQLATLFAREGVSLKAWVDQQAPDGATAVHYAVANNALEALDCLLRLEASVDIQDHAGRTPIDTAAIDGHLDACRALDSGGSTVRSSMVQYLFDAAAHGREDLSALGVDVNAKDMMGQAALHYAAVKKDMNAFDLLVRAGARLDEVNKCGRSPLHVLLSAGLEAECWEYMNNEAFEPYRPPQGGAAQSPMIRISAEDLRNATNNFSNEALVKVERIYSVYVGKLVVGEKEMRVAIKVLEGDDRDIRLLNEVINLRRAHDKKHIVEILGFCTECFAHVSEFVQEDSLESLLRRSHAQRFHWYDRVRVALEIAEALCQLRRLKPPILHRDLRPTNILLDKKLQTRLVNFGMGCICPMIDEAGGQSTDSMPGEFPYVDPIVLRSHVYVETSDVYALGITMVRLLTGTGENGRHTPVWSVEKALVGGQLHTMLDATAGAWPADTSDRFARLAVECTAINESRRPDIDTVVKVLAKLQANRPKPVEQGPVPAGFTCPITHAIMDDPVCLSDGFTYERSAIKNWLARNMGGEVDAPKRSPMTNAELSSTELYPNTVLRNLIYEWKEQQQEA